MKNEQQRTHTPRKGNVNRPQMAFRHTTLENANADMVKAEQSVMTDPDNRPLTEHKRSQSSVTSAGLAISPALPRSAAAAKPTKPVRDVQANRRNTRKVKSKHAPLTLPQQKRGYVAIGRASTEQDDAKQSISPYGGQSCSVCQNSPALPRSAAAAKPTKPVRDVQANRRNTRKVKSKHAPLTLPQQKRGYAATGRASTAGQDDTRYSITLHGDHSCSASSNGRKLPYQQVYDPLMGRHSIPAVNVPGLLELIVEDANFLQAVYKVNADPDKAPGIDRRTVSEVCEPLLASAGEREKIRQNILHGRYAPAPVRTSLIPKANGKMRTLGIATVLDRIVQTMILQAVSVQMPDHPWSPYSFAYQPGLGVADAIAEVNCIRTEDYKFGIALDLKAFFDNVPHDRLIHKLKAHLADKRVVRLVTAFLTPVIIGKHKRRIRNRIGTPQGSVISPWLASMLYMDELDQEMTRRGLRFVRYADDVTVFCHSRNAAKRVKARLISFIEGTMKCPVNRDKTKIVEIKRISLLGVELKSGKWHIQRAKERQACSGFLNELRKYDQNGTDLCLIRAAQRMYGFLNFYTHIPGIAIHEVKSIYRWCRKHWQKLPYEIRLKYPQWFMCPFMDI